jgi:hypothetical protein
LEKDILEVTLGENLTHTWRPASTIWGRDEPPASGEGAGNLGNERPLLVDPKPRQLFKPANPHCEPFDKLSHIDYKLQDIVTDVAKALDALGSESMEGNVEETAVKELESGMEIIAKNLTHIRNICGLTDEEDKLQEAMVERYESILSGMEQASITIQARKTAQSSPHVYHNRK